MSNSVCGCTHVADDELTCWIGHAPRWGAALSLSSFSFSLQIRVSSHARLVMLHRDELRQQSSDNMQSSSAEASVSLTAASTAFVPIIAVLEKLAGMCTAQCQPPLPLPDLSLMFRFQGISEVTSFQNTPAAAFTWLLMIVTWAPLVVRTIFAKFQSQENVARQNWQKQLAKDFWKIGKPPKKFAIGQGNLESVSGCRWICWEFSVSENFWHYCAPVVPSRQAAAVLPRKLLNNSSLEALTDSGGKGKGKIGIYWHTLPCRCRRSHNALKMFLVSAPQEI